MPKCAAHVPTVFVQGASPAGGLIPVV
jgi:hypothetical protein